MPGRHANTADYRYGFNNMELDNEVKGEGNSIDFGARMLDPRVGRWFAKDPLGGKLPDLSPYTFVNNDPIRFIDPDGKFLIDVHKRITKAAFGRHRIIKGRSSEVGQNISAYRIAIIGYPSSPYSGSVVAPDVRALPWYLGGGNQESYHEEHFDNMNYDGIVKNFDRLSNEVEDILSSFDKGVIDAKDLGNKVGEVFHAVQDFYSHSNYIELYEEVYGQTDVTEIPTIEEAMSSKNYKKFARVLKDKLVTGNYPAEGEGSHKEMNHDLGKGSMYSEIVDQVAGKEVNWNSGAAEAVATKATKELNDKIEKKIESKSTEKKK